MPQRNKGSDIAEETAGTLGKITIRVHKYSLLTHAIKMESFAKYILDWKKKKNPLLHAFMHLISISLTWSKPT